VSAVMVVKVGGNELGDAVWVRALARRIAARAGPVVVVHGGGREVSELQAALGVEPVWHEGLRVTTPETLTVLTMVLSGLINKRLVGALQNAGVDAIGVSGEDGALIRAEVARGGVLGRVGEVSQVRVPLLRQWLQQGLTPVVSPVSRAPDGGSLNVNADEAAAAVAAGMSAAELLLVSNIPGVSDGTACLPEIAAGEVEALIAAGVASAGMVPKLRAAARAATAGVEVRIGRIEMLADPGAGTRVRAAAATAR
jgi:acetylglutamate kinase